MTQPRLSPEAVVLLNKLADGDLFSMFRELAGFNPTDKIVQPKLGDYLDSLFGGTQGNALRGVSSFNAPDPVLTTRGKADPASDEFDASALDPSWGFITASALDATPPARNASFVSPTTTLRASLTLRPGWLLMQPASHFSQYGVHKAVDASVAAMYYVRFSMDSNITTVGDVFAFGLSQTSTGAPDLNNQFGITLNRATGENSWTINAGRQVGGSSTSLYSAEIDSFNQPVNGLAIMHTPGSPGSFSAFAFSDFGGWKFLGTQTAAIVPTRAYLGCINDTVPNTIYGVDYFRRVAGLPQTL